MWSIILNIFGQMRSANDQMRVHLTNGVRIWPLVVGLTGVRTLRHQDTSASRHFGTGAEVSIGHFDISAEVSGHFGTGAEVSVGHFGTSAEVSRTFRHRSQR